MLEIFYWVLLLLWFLFGAYFTRVNRDYFLTVGGFIAWLLFVIIGLTIFHNPFK